MDFAIGGAGPALLLALLLGLRHATDPDHLAALVTLATDPAREGARAAARLGLAWGLGHALTCFALGLIVVAAGSALPDALRAGAEIAVGGMIVVLALRLLLRWRRGRFHAHPHRHGEISHSHPHLHERPLHAARADGADEREHPHVHVHAHAERLGRSPLEAFGVGLVHGVGGSALGAALLAAAEGDAARATGLLLCFAAGTVVAMSGVSAALGVAFDRASHTRVLERTAPVLGVATLSFGVWYAGAALVRWVAA